MKSIKWKIVVLLLVVHSSYLTTAVSILNVTACVAMTLPFAFKDTFSANATQRPYALPVNAMQKYCLVTSQNLMRKAEQKGVASQVKRKRQFNKQAKINKKR